MAPSQTTALPRNLESRRIKTSLIDEGSTIRTIQVVWPCTDGRTGGRTAWSTIALVNGTPYAARFWYDGSFMDQAKEDAAEMALRNLTGRLSQTTEPPPASYYRNLTTA
jgi:hypothetical protein